MLTDHDYIYGHRYGDELVLGAWREAQEALVDFGRAVAAVIAEMRRQR